MNSIDSSVDPTVESSDVSINDPEELIDTKNTNDSSISSISHVDNQEPENEDQESISTMDMALTFNTLKPVDQYKKPFLEKVAKKYSIPITCKEGTTRRQLKKEELYEKIKEKLAE